MMFPSVSNADYEYYISTWPRIISYFSLKCLDRGEIMEGPNALKVIQRGCVKHMHVFGDFKSTTMDKRMIKKH